MAISGLALNHSLIGIDFRTADGVLVGVSRSSASDEAQVYTINTFTGGATAIGLLFALPGSSGFGVDFNPVPGALRLVTDAEANRRITMGGAGVVNTDTNLNPVPTAGLQISGAAYSNNVPGGVGGNTTLYVVDSTSGNLYSQGSVNFPGGGAISPNTGTLFLIGSLGLGTNLSTQIGLDISDLGLAFLSIADGNGDRLYRFNEGVKGIV